MSGSLVRPALTVPQARALLSVAGFAGAGEPEGWDPAVLDRAGRNYVQVLAGYHAERRALSPFRTGKAKPS